MAHPQEQQLLEQYADIAQTKVMRSQSDLAAKDRAMPEMLNWCRQQQTVVVLQSGIILTSEPSARAAQNCKIVMQNKGLVPGPVYPAFSQLVSMLLENAADAGEENQRETVSVTTQQQRLRTLVKEALEVDASDIHIEVRDHVARIRFRKHGELYLHAEWLPKLGREVASVAFNKETDHAVTHFNPLVPQNASMPLTLDGREVRLRLASLPAHRGFDVVLRILTTADEQIDSLEQLGYLPWQIELLKKAVSMPHGAVVLGGPTGSGKTTTLASCMQLVDSQRKLYTIEDPVEKYIEGATQVPVNVDHTDRGFASMARTALRMDPDVIVLGEMRDEDTAQVMTRAAITGHLVFSTVHANSATGVITRLEDLGVSTSLLASPSLLTCIVCQRLAPTLCTHCALPVTESASHQPHLARWREVLGFDLSNVKVRGQDGCSHCHGLGIAGRTVIAEIIWLDEICRRYIQDKDIVGWKQYLRDNHWQSYADQLENLIKQGRCDPFDAEKLIGRISKLSNEQQYNYGGNE